MRQYGLLLLLVLGVSSTALGYCRINITIDEITCGQPITGSTQITCSGACTYSGVDKTYVDNTLYADVYIDCACTCGSSVVPTQGTVFSEATCGRYTVVVRVWCNYTGCGCFPYSCYRQPVFCGMAMKTFTVRCDGCGCGPCRCVPLQPSAPSKDCVGRTPDRPSQTSRRAIPARVPHRARREVEKRRSFPTEEGDFFLRAPVGTAGFEDRESGQERSRPIICPVQSSDDRQGPGAWYTNVTPRLKREACE